MKQQDKELLLEDLCARLPYKPKVKIGEYHDYTLMGIDLSKEKPIIVELDGHSFEASCKNVQPVLRPLSSMTEEEERELNSYGFTHSNDDEDFDNYVNYECCSIENRFHYIDRCSVINCYKFLISRHFDINGLIPKELAFKAPIDMYK